MSLNENVVSPPRLINIGGETFSLSPLTIQQMYGVIVGYEERHASKMQNPLDVVCDWITSKQKSGDPIPDAMIKHLTNQSLEIKSGARKVTMTAEEIERESCTVDGATELLFAHMQASKINCTFERCRELVVKETPASVAMKLGRLNGRKGDEDPKWLMSDALDG